MSSGHPKGLKPLFFTEMWERLGFYLIVGILYLYIIDTERGGLGMSNASAGEIYGTYLAFVYFTPFLGGMIAAVEDEAVRVHDRRRPHVGPDRQPATAVRPGTTALLCDYSAPLGRCGNFFGSINAFLATACNALDGSRPVRLKPVVASSRLGTYTKKRPPAFNVLAILIASRAP